jgi:hypothetical protein
VQDVILFKDKKLLFHGEAPFVFAAALLQTAD